MSSSRFIGYIIGVVILGVVSIVSVNYIVDPTSVFGTRFFPEYGYPQERYLKIEYLKKHKNYNTFLLGGSRAGVITTEAVDSYFPGAKTYNLSLLDGIVSDYEKHIEWLIKNSPNVSHIILQLDWLSEYKGHDPRLATMDEFHPEMSGRSKYGFLFDYLAKVNWMALRETISNNTGGLNQLKYDMTKGYWSRPLRDKLIERNCAEYFANEASLADGKKSLPKKLDSALFTNTLATITRIKSLLDQKKVKLTVLLAPRNHSQLDAIEVSDYELFITQLVKITDFTNFMYYNKVIRYSNIQEN